MNQWVRRPGLRWHYVGWSDDAGIHTQCGQVFAKHDAEMTSAGLPATPFRYCGRCYTKYANRPGINWTPAILALGVLALMAWSGVQCAAEQIQRILR